MTTSTNTSDVAGIVVFSQILLKLEAAFTVIYTLKDGEKKKKKVIGKRINSKCSFITLYKIIK